MRTTKTSDRRAFSHLAKESPWDVCAIRVRFVCVLWLCFALQVFIVIAITD